VHVSRAGKSHEEFQGHFQGTSERDRLTVDAAPLEIRLRKASRLVALEFDDGSHFELPFEYLRVHSPSAEVKGHGPGQEVLQTGKEHVRVKEIEPIGHYAVRLHFDDGHNTGLYTWEYLYELGRDRERNWQTYLDRLSAAGYARRP
jgi:DUF971 family protein